MNRIERGKKALLLSVGKAPPFTLDENLQELKELTESADLGVCFSLKQSLKSLDPAFLIGLGKREELKQAVLKHRPSYVIFDHDLSGVQTRNLEKLLALKVLDRSQLILEIFAQRAKSHEGKMQVELACLTDQMSRMTGAWLGSLSRQGGRYGSKGPGEKAIETDRRQIKRRIKKVRQKLKKVELARARRRDTRKKHRVPSFALIGYTNSGKSALLNRLTKANEETRGQVFMTLDPKTKRLFLPGIADSVLTDTVGFIRKLPPRLLSAFKATLEESAEADVLLHVIDASQAEKTRHIKTVEHLVDEFGWSEKPMINVFNKADLLPPEERFLQNSSESDSLLISAKKGWNLPALKDKMKMSLKNLKEKECVELFFPKDKEHKIYDLSREAEILKKESGEKGSLCQIQISSVRKAFWREYFLPKKSDLP